MSARRHPSRHRRAGFPAARWLVLAVLVGVLVVCTSLRVVAGAERTERFDKDPQWDGRNYRPTAPPATVRQDFGYSRSEHAGGKIGEIGGLITAAGEPAYYAKKIADATFEQKLSASGTLACTGRKSHVLFGFFNAGTINEWRTPNTIALRLAGRGDVFYAYLEYCTSRWRAGGDEPRSFPTVKDPQTGRMQFKGFPLEGVHRWSFEYDPQANDGHGAVTAMIDGEAAICNLAAGHKEDGATFNRFGLLNVMKSADGGGEIWLGDLAINGEREDFSSDPKWDGMHNRHTYTTSLVRPRFDFGFSPTHFAGGQAGGELGGVVFRGDCRYPERMAYYGDHLEDLTLKKPLKASGKVCLRRGVSDSTMLIGFFHARDSMASSPAQDQGLPKNFLGISTDGPSREGFYFSPTYRADGDAHGDAGGLQPPRILPDGVAHDWTLEYSPTADDGRGGISVTLDRQSVHLPLGKDHQTAGARFDRFGIITTWIDGNSQTIFFDDLTYTFRQE